MRASVRILVFAWLVPAGSAWAAPPPTPVTVVNTPLPVEVVDVAPVEITPAEPVLARASDIIPPGPAGAILEVYVVPAGMRLVVEHASVMATSPSAATFRLVDAAGLPYHALVATEQGLIAGSTVRAASQPVRFVVGPEQEVRLEVLRGGTSENTTVSASLSGYLVPDL